MRLRHLVSFIKTPVAFSLALFFLALSAHASNWFVRPSSTGSNTGADWNNAWAISGISWGSVKAGDIIWLAGGSYSGGLQTGASGTAASPILIYRARTTDAAATGAAGWSSSFDSTVVLKGGIDVPSGSYLTIDGRIHNGISITITSAGGDCVSGAENGSISYINFNNIACIGPYSTGTVGGGGTHGFNLAPSSNTVSFVTLHACSVVGMGESLRASNWANVTIEYCYLADTNTNSAEHDDVIYSYPSKNVTFRYNLINNSPSDGLFFEFGGATNFSFYGNLYYNTVNWFLCTKQASGSTYGPIYIYNNVFMCPNQPGAWVSTNDANMTGATYVYNNIFYNVSNDMSGTGVTSDYNAYNYTTLGGFSWNSSEKHSFTFTGNPFVALPANPQPVGAIVAPWGTAGDFHLAPATAAKFLTGIALASDGFLNKDMDGNTRSGTWSMGAYQYGAGASPTPTTTPPTVTGMKVSSLR
jgi:hypothetical protein